jgi:hypothetical protein
MWGGIAWPVIPNPGVVCIVGEEEPENEQATYGNLILLDQEAGRTIESLLKNTIALKDIYCATHFYANPGNEALFDRFKIAEGLTRYGSENDEWKTLYPHFKEEWMTARLMEAPQADNPEYGLQLIHDWLYNENRLKITKNVQASFDEGNVLPVTNDMLKTGVPPVIEALRHVLSAYSRNPSYPGNRKGSEVYIGNFHKQGRKDPWDGHYQMIVK